MPTKTDPVLLVVELVESVTEELLEIQAALETLDNQLIDPEFVIDDDGEIARLQMRKKMLEKRMEAEWVPDISEAQFAKVLGARKVLERRMNAPSKPRGDFGGIPAVGADFPGGPWRGFKGAKLRRNLDQFNDSFRKLGRTLNRVKPSIMDWWQLLALLIPVVITLGAALIGVVAALGGMAVAAGAVVGVGLAGWGDNASETMQELRREVGMLKSELFAAMQPAATEFAPISRGFIRGIPEQVARLNDELKRLTAFEEGLAAAGGGLIGWVEESIDAIADMQEMVVQVALRMGDALGGFLIELLQFGLQELYKNQDAYATLAEIFVEIIATLFNLSKAITFALSTFETLFDAVVLLTGWMGNKWVASILAAVIGLTTLTFVLGNVMASLLGITGLGALSFFSSLGSQVMVLAGQLYQMWIALELIEKALVGIFAATLGIPLVWGLQEMWTGMSGPGAGATGVAAAQGGTTVNNVNIEGDVGKREMNRLLDHMETQQ